VKETVIYGIKITCPLSYFNLFWRMRFSIKNAGLNCPAARIGYILCYTLNMDENQQSWRGWASTLQRWGIKEGVASLLESAGSLAVFLAQIVYLSQPLLSGSVSTPALQAFARVLENPSDRREFVSFLREAPTSGPSA
jgi:hypothetical protein